MMQSIVPKTDAEIRRIARAGKIVAGCHKALADKCVPGATTESIDRFVDWYMVEHGAYPAQKGHKGYPFASCTSVNEVACHGFPSSYKLKKGDIITVDIVADYKGWKADSAWTYMIGEVSPQVRQLVKASKAAFRAGLAQAVVGNDISAIGSAIEQRAEKDGFHVIGSFIGHGIGKELHEPPHVHHVRTRASGIKLEEGMVITIEPILSVGSPQIYIAHDGWTARTVDHSLTSQFEHTVAITKAGPKILTKLGSTKRKT
ncbi:MAG: type I methionyl aminopeptidase [Candidatus Pristimantibacillus lignocellulolyticus]|uniref:Methionine aminopeptidase n=1 Tax=Candidatus Pristimantibacillus lignocellulolyticus TaxID=2994561 RepID=A0A9J6ZKK8_9BACL|nr:MAG: type I methionyl aminopeptidase [Candidatus Pristimantibacillus lignocellulolyticus]